MKLNLIPFDPIILPPDIMLALRHPQYCLAAGGILLALIAVWLLFIPRNPKACVARLGGAIPLEALRLGCESYALDLNPVAHIIQLCTLVYPQKFGKANPNAKGSAEDGTWAGLAAEVGH